MRTRRHLSLLLVAGLLAVPTLLTTTACGSLGTRGTTHSCPAGEVCSPATPAGLRFYGAGLGGTLSNSPAPLAVGGHQRIRFEDASVGSPALPPHHVVSSAPATLGIGTSGVGQADLVGVAAGSADVRVLDASDQLLDRIGVSVAPIDHVSVTASDDLIVALGQEWMPAPVAFAAGATRATIALVSADGGRLVDDAMQVTSTASITVPSWDTIEGSFGAADVPVHVVAGGRPFDAVVRAAGPLDDIELATWLLPDGITGTPSVGAGDAVCVVPRAGGARVVGGTFTFAFTVDGHAVASDSSGRCAALPSGLGTTTSVVVTSGSVSRTFQLTVSPSRASATMLLADAPFVMPHLVPSALGDRARLSWGL
jgi:hypothetical protein